MRLSGLHCSGLLFLAALHVDDTIGHSSSTCRNRVRQVVGVKVRGFCHACPRRLLQFIQAYGCVIDFNTIQVHRYTMLWWYVQTCPLITAGDRSICRVGFKLAMCQRHCCKRSTHAHDRFDINQMYCVVRSLLTRNKRRPADEHTQPR